MAISSNKGDFISNIKFVTTLGITNIKDKLTIRKAMF